MKKHYTVQCGYAGYFANTVTVEADTLDEALEKAVAAANADGDGWRSIDHCGPTFVDAACKGRDADPWDYGAALPIPDPLHRGGLPRPHPVREHAPDWIRGRAAGRHPDRPAPARPGSRLPAARCASASPSPPAR